MANRKNVIILLVLLILAVFVNIGLCSAALQVTVFTDKLNYNVGENIFVYGEVKANGLPIENALVALEVRGPSGSPVVIRTLSTDALGRYSVSFSLSSQELLGTYTVNVTVSYSGEKVSNTTYFNLENALPFILTLTVGRSAYTVEEPISLYGDVKLGGMPINGALVALEVQDPKGTTVLLRVVETDTSGLYALTFQVPSGSVTGNYTVIASATYENQAATASAIFQIKQTIPADINGDGKVNIIDITLVAMAWGSVPGQPRWDSRCDLDGNGIINIIDITLVAREYRP